MVKQYLAKAMESLGQRLGLDNVDNGYIALRYATVRLRDLEQGSWKFHPLLGFWYGISLWAVSSLQ